MRNIEVNWTDNGLEVLFDGWPSPRCERYLRNVRCIGRWLRRAGWVFVIGPAQAFGLALVFAMLDGSLRLGADVTDNLQRLHLVVDANPTRHSQAGRCPDDSVPVQPTVPCIEDADVAAKEAEDMLWRLRIFYLAGMWFGIDTLLRERRWKQRLG
jgi:hypothetical protein